MGGGTYRHYNHQHRKSKSKTRIQNSGDCQCRCGELMGTITQNIGCSAPRNGFKLIEIYEVHDCSQ